MEILKGKTLLSKLTYPKPPSSLFPKLTSTQQISIRQQNFIFKDKDKTFYFKIQPHNSFFSALRFTDETFSISIDPPQDIKLIRDGVEEKPVTKDAFVVLWDEDYEMKFQGQVIFGIVNQRQQEIFTFDGVDLKTREHVTITE